MNTNLVIVPTRSRPDNAERFARHFFENSSISDLVFGIDNDQINMYPKINGAMYEVNPNMKLVPKLNLIANKYVDQYKTITFLGDDHVLKTKNWDASLYTPIQQIGYGFSFANDLFQTPTLPTSIMESTNIIKALGFMAPESLYHMYMAHNNQTATTIMIMDLFMVIKIMISRRCCNNKKTLSCYSRILEVMNISI